MDSERFAKIRAQLGRTQADFAQDLGVSANTVARWERGEISIPATVEKLAELLVERRAPHARHSGVARDPHHQAILDALEGHVDPEAFEACACALLRSEHPTLAAVRGGTDAGFDGEVAGPDNQITPLIVTTARNYLSNFKRSIAQAANVASVTTALFATSRRITSKKRQELRRLSRNYGLLSLGIYDQDWFGEALYQDSSWSKRLFGIGGRPRALSPFPAPRNSRFTVSQLLGRQAELQALQAASADAMLVGGPGFGKTALLEVFASQTNALFLVDDDREALANSLRVAKPQIVIVDDAHVHLQSLKQLNALRSELAADFQIVACTWPYYEDHVKRSLSGEPVAIILLEQLDANTIAKLVQAAGLSGPDLLVHSIVNQAEGRPGLAVTLTRLCVESASAHEVWSGQALLEHLCPALEATLKSNVKHLLGCFSFGGKSGFALEPVARLLSRPLDEVGEILAALAPAGIIRQGRDGRISVWPATFRWQLVRQAFFGEGKMDFHPFLENAPNREDAIESMIGARSRGADIPQLDSLVRDSNSKRLWLGYAQLGRVAAETALRERSDFLIDLAPILLEQIPDEVIPRLMELSEQSGSQIRDIFEKWVVRTDMVDQIVRRRTALVDSIATKYLTTVVPGVAIEVLCFAMRPGFEWVSTDPGLGNTLTMTWGMLRSKQLVMIEDLWPRILPIVARSFQIPWDCLVDVVNEWRIPDPRVNVSSEDATAMWHFAVRMAKDLANIAGSHAGARHRTKQLLLDLKADPGFDLDAEFATLHPLETWDGRNSWDETHKKWADRATDLGREWSLAAPDEIASRIVEYEQQAAEASIRAPNLTSVAVRSLASTAKYPRDFISSFATHKVSPDHLWPLASRLAKEEPIQTIRFLLSHPEYANLALELLLSVDVDDLVLVEDCVARASNAASLVESRMSWVVRIEVARRLLTHSNPEISVAAALGEWRRSEPPGVRAALALEWQQAVLRSARGMDERLSYHLQQILSSDLQLACEWLCTFVAHDYPNRYRLLDLAKTIARALSTEQRRRVLRAIDGGGFLYRLVASLVGDELSLYRDCLERQDLRAYHLEAIACGFSPRWADKLMLAQRHGYSTAQLADASFPSMRQWSGNESDYWQPYLKALEPFLTHDGECVRMVAAQCSRMVEENIKRCLTRERIEAVRGYAAPD